MNAARPGGVPGRRAACIGILGGLVAAMPTALPAAAAEFPARSTGRPSFLVDATAVPQGPDSARIEVNWQIPYSQLVFREEGGQYRARYDVTVVVTDGNRQVGGDVWELRARTDRFEETRGSRKAQARRSVTVPNGRYDVRVTVTDRNTGSASAVRAELSARFGENRIGLSDLRFVRYTEAGVVPNATREIPIGEPDHAARMNIHPVLSGSGQFRIRWGFLGPGGREKASGDTTVTLTGAEPVPFEIPIPSEELQAGAYQLEIRVSPAAGGPDDRRKVTFFVRLTSSWFALHRDEALDVFEIVATDEEFRNLRRAEGQAWAKAVEEFWESRNPVPGSVDNAFRDTVQQRMETAASWFREPFRKPGWKTDRGRILIRFGVPARRTVRSADFDGPASELWEYHSPRRTFFFVDERGSGEFWLRG